MRTKLFFQILGVVILFSLYACKENSSNSSKSGSSIHATENSGSDIYTDTANYTTIQWLDSIQEFGKVTDGEKVLISFHFKNTGTKPLIVSNVSAGCGCTVPEKPEAPIPPGEDGVIKAEFNSSGRVGKVSKNVTVTCNTATQNYTLQFEGEVIEKKQPQ
jgi:hypothetical protein